MLFIVAQARGNGPPDMKLIAGGEFVMGSDDDAALPNEQPARRVRVSSFWMDETAVTNAQFAKFVEATGYVTTAEKPVDWEELKKQLPPGVAKPAEEQLKPGSLVFVPPAHAVDLRDMSGWWRWTPGASWRHPRGPGSDLAGKENFPVVQVSWDDAAAYAKWAGKRLPTEAEWEYAARGGLHRMRFAWGDEFAPAGKHRANTFQGKFPQKDTGDDGHVGAAPVKSFPPNGYGLYDMAGNVWNFCSDFYRADWPEQQHQKPMESNPPGPPDSFDPTRPIPDTPQHVIKGGSYLCNESYCASYRPSARRGTPLDTSSEHVGFRCVMSEESRQNR
jgi:formylglycine-generating enzyme required for sulfatase activity